MNRATKLIVTTLGILGGIGGIDHGFFETLHGSVPTGGLFVQSIGPASRMWVYGTEDAFTLVPNFLVTGLLAITLSLALIVWSIRFVDRKNGPIVLTALFVLLFLSGGGVAQVLFFAIVCAATTRIHAPLSWWRRVLPAGLRQAIGGGWPVALTAGVLLFLAALEIAIAGWVPGLSDPWQKELICWASLAAALIAFLIAFVSGFAADIQASQPIAPEPPAIQRSPAA